MRISDWSSDVCSSDLPAGDGRQRGGIGAENPRTEADGRNKRQFSQGVKFALGKAALRSGHDRPGPCIPRGAGTNRLQRLGDRPSLARSEEHTSELQSLMRISYAVFCLKKKKQIKRKIID